MVYATYIRPELRQGSHLTAVSVLCDTRKNKVIFYLKMLGSKERTSLTGKMMYKFLLFYLSMYKSNR